MHERNTDGLPYAGARCKVGHTTTLIFCSRTPYPAHEQTCTHATHWRVESESNDAPCITSYATISVMIILAQLPTCVCTQIYDYTSILNTLIIPLKM